ncbi:hypothetical protein B9J07_25570 [Sinorhizobium sp. LM21]|nr:hypothetical protein phi3LM21_p36 [Sinorhizobium phage phi3LM21]OWZ90928.1 hypothetical protein B9J07_25570 [Sinorhizobium sp. LM21]
MKYIVVGDVVRFGVGQAIKLSAAQIDVRRHVLEVTDGDKGEVTASGPVEFKRGEEIGLKDKFEDLPRSLSDVLEPAAKAKKAAPAKVEAGKKVDQSGAADLDALEMALEAAEGALAAAVEKRGLSGIDADTYTDEQKALVADELAAYAAAKTAYDAAIED